MKSALNRNLAIDWIKGLLITFVVIEHTWVSGFRGYLAVEVFFFISGFYLMQHFLRKPTTTICYTWSRIRGIFPPFFICLLLSCLIQYKRFIPVDSFDSLVNNATTFFSTFTFTKDSGIDVSNETFLIGSWFLRVLIIGSFILYGILEYNERLACLILLPLFSLLGFNALFTIYDSVDSSNLFNRIGIIPIPLLRGISWMAIGALIGKIYSTYKSSIERHPVFVNTMGIISFGIFILLLFTEDSYDKYAVITVPWFLLAAVFDGSWLNHALHRINGSLFSRIGQYTLYILCVHYPAMTVAYWINDHILNSSITGFTLVLYLAIMVGIAAYLLSFLCFNILNHCFVRQSDHTRI